VKRAERALDEARWEEAERELVAARLKLPAYRPNVLRQDEAGSYSLALGELRLEQARYAEAEEQLRWAAGHSTSQWFHDRAHELLAYLMVEQGRFDELRPLSPGRLEIPFRSVWEWSEGRYTLAEDLVSRARHEECGVTARAPPPTCVAILDRLAWILAELGRYADARAVASELSEEAERAYPDGHRERARVHRRRGALALLEGDLALAEAELPRAQAIYEATYADWHPEVARTLDLLGSLRRAQGDLAEAERLHRQAWVSLQRIFGADHPDAARAQSHVAEDCALLAGPCDAARLFDAALAARAAVFGADHPEVAESLVALAAWRLARAEFAAAEPLIQRALAIRERAFPPSHPLVIRGLELRASLLERTGRAAEASAVRARIASAVAAVGPTR
jgi:tetratricopeptide (TPR) repeat protein